MKNIPRIDEPNLAPQPQTASLDGRGGRHRLGLWMLLIVGLAVGAYLGFSRMGKARVPTAEASPVTPRPGIPVAATEATQGDLNRYLTALGTVTPFYTVTIKSRVDGQLVKVNFREGQIVHEGDLLLQIDPRPYQVQLEQAE